ncbi:MAG: hypothetical protein QM662_05880 [Gordonia sp. (in: high G+C Gram-positive bacteria)]
MADALPRNRERPITVDERSGVLHPERLARFEAGWIAPAPAVSAVVDQYWHVSWAVGLTVLDTLASLMVSMAVSGARTVRSSPHPPDLIGELVAEVFVDGLTRVRTETLARFDGPH